MCIALKKRKRYFVAGIEMPHVDPLPGRAMHLLNTLCITRLEQLADVWRSS